MLFLAPAVLFSATLVQKNPPVRPADADSPVLIWDVDPKLARSLLYDMLRNAARVPLEDIVRRQQLIGYDYDVLRPAEPGDWREAYTDDRIAFVRTFYKYAHANPNGRPQLWSEWLKASVQ